MEWNPTRIRALRTALRLPQERFASKLGASPKTVRNWERGTHPPSLTLQRALDDAFEAASPRQKQRFFAALASGPETATAPDFHIHHEDDGTQPLRMEGEHRTSRGQAIHALDPLTARMLDAASMESLELSRQAEASDLGPATLDHLDSMVERFGLAYLFTAATDLFVRVRSCRQYVTGLMDGKQTISEKKRLLGIAGWLSGLLGHLSLDLGDDLRADAHCLTALKLGRDAGHAVLISWVFGTQALIATYAGRPRQAVEFAGAGRRAAPRCSDVGVRASALEGRAWARIGDRKAAEEAMTDAEGAFAEVSEQATHSILSFDSPYLPFYAGTAYVWLEQPLRAQECTARAIELCDADPTAWPVARVLARIDRASALVQREEPEAACRLATEALVLSERPVEPVRRRAHEFRESLKRFPALTAVHDFDEQLRASYDGFIPGSGPSAR